MRFLCSPMLGRTSKLEGICCKNMEEGYTEPNGVVSRTLNSQNGDEN